MSVTYGFYNSKNQDRRYDAIQMSSIFDGIIRDGVLQHYGGRMIVKASTGMMVTVESGRAWFNHTWTLNDAILPLTLPQSEVLLNRIDAVVIEVDSREEVRANSIKIVKGTPASNPSRPAMVKTNVRWQYPLAYIRVNTGATAIRQADITNAVGTSECPFVTAPLEKMSIDDLVAQWADEWDRFYNKISGEMIDSANHWEQAWEEWYTNRVTQVNDAFNTWTTQWDQFYRQHVGSATADKDRWNAMMKNWYESYVQGYNDEMQSFRQEATARFDAWFYDLQNTLDGDVAGNLASRITELDKRLTSVEAFRDAIKYEGNLWFKVIGRLYNGHRPVFGSDGTAVLDDQNDEIFHTLETNEDILDNNGDPILGRKRICVDVACPYNNK